jgi:hypothetical protein
MPEAVERYLQVWQEEYPGRVRLDAVEGYSGHKTYAATVTDFASGEDGKIGIFLPQPHGHEPASTAAEMQVIHDLLTGSYSDDSGQSISAREILERMLLVFVPLGNPDGRSRSPVEYWYDQYSQDEALSYWSGRLSGASRWWRESSRHPILHLSEFDFDPMYPIGLRWEQFEEDGYVDCWNVPGSLDDNPSTLARLAKIILARHAFDLVLDMHQCPEMNYVQVWMPNIRAQTSRQELAGEIAAQIERDWDLAGAMVRERELYENDFVNALHEQDCGKPAVLTIEIGAGVGFNVRMDKKQQKDLSMSSIKSSITFLLGREIA